MPIATTNAAQAPLSGATIAHLARDRCGATAMEYALLAAMIAIASIMALQLSGGAVAETFNNASAAMPAAGNAEIPPTP